MKKMLKKLVCLVMVVMVLVATSTTIWVSAYSNLIPSANSNFDTGSVWSAGGANYGGSSDSTVYRGSSGKSMKVTDNDTGRVKYASTTNIGPIDPTKYYRLVYWVRTDVEGTTTRFQWNQMEDSTLKGYTIITTTPTANTWTKVERTITPLADSVPNGNIKHKITTATGYFNLFAYATDANAVSTGTAWYDDVTLTEYDPTTNGTPTNNKDTGGTPTPTKTPMPTPTPTNNKDTGAVSGGSAMFNDIGTHWAKADIIEMAGAGLIKGKGEGKFDPESSITRAEFLALATRAAGLDVKPYQGLFNDIKADAWYSGVVQVAYDNKIIDENMIVNKAFNPTAQITREEMTSIIINTYKLKKQIEIKDINATKFSDTASISKWALKYVDKATELGIIKGMTETTFAPSQTATRAQSAVILKRLLAQIK